MMKVNARSLIPWLDLTRLEENDHAADVVAFAKKAVTSYGPVAAVCVYPRFVGAVYQRLAAHSITVASVVNFPGGDKPSQSLQTLQKAVQAGAREIDAVLPYQQLQQGERQSVLQFVQACRAACGPDRCLKIILETGELVDEDLIVQAAELAIEGGADFIKTSTGKTKVGATPAAAQTILNVIRQHKKKKIGFKVSGGVRTLADAFLYVDLVANTLGEEWLNAKTFRIGASSLLDVIKGEVAGETLDDR